MKRRCESIRKNRWSGSLIFLCCFGVSFNAHAGLGGNVEVGVDVENANNTEVDVNAELKYRSKRSKGFRAIVEAKASAVERDFHLKDVVVDYRYSKKLHISLGYSKKVLGVEYEDGKRKRIPIHRSLPYRKMESLGLVGRQLNLRVDLELGKKRHRTDISAALGGDNSRDYNLQLSLKKARGNLGLGVWGLLERHRIDKGFIPVFSEVLALWYESESGRVLLEAIHGVDAIRTEYQSHLGNDRTVHFVSPRLDLARFVAVTENTQIVPFVQMGVVFDDLNNPDENSLLFTAGTRFQWHDLRIGINVETVGVKDVTRENHRQFKRKSVYGQVIYFF